MRDLRGSLWKGWDLHVHTPASIIHNYGPNDTVAWERFIAGVESLPPDIRVIGINDYLFFDGYERVLEEHRRGRMANIELILPVIELRLDKFGGASRNHLSRVNYHVIFAPDLSTDVIDRQFLSRLQASYRLDPAHGSELQTWAGALSRESLRDLGERIIATVPVSKRAAYGDPLVEGFNNLNFSLSSVRGALQSTYLTNRFVTAVGKTEWDAIQWNDGTIADKKDVINGTDFVFTAAESAEACLEARRKLREGGVNWRLLDCSDAHQLADSSDKDRLGNCFTWINADTEFEGLRRALHEYEDRVYLGVKPPKLKRVAANRTKYIRAVSIAKTAGSGLAEPWLDGVRVKLNYGLVAIIGNKGSGKSALIDVLGLLGDSSRHDDASFLNTDRFCRPNDNKAREFEATSEWADGTVETRRLDSTVAESAAERVTYIPQKAFEKICNELGGGERGPFDIELKRVIFSHVSRANRLGCSTLDELLALRTGELEIAIGERREVLASINQQITELWSYLAPEYRKRLMGQLEIRQAELRAHDGEKPVEVPPPPGDDDPGRRQIVADIENKEAQLRAAEDQITAARERASTLHRHIALLDGIQIRLRTFALRYDELRTTSRADLIGTNVELDELIELHIDWDLLATARSRDVRQLTDTLEGLGEDTEESSAFEDLDDLSNDLSALPTRVPVTDLESGGDVPSSESLLSRQNRLMQEIDDLRLSLDVAHRGRQTYIDALRDWQSKRDAILGRPDVTGTIHGLEAELDALETVPSDLASLAAERNGVAREIHVHLNRMVELYRGVYAPVQTFIEAHSVARDVFNLQFHASVVSAGFEERFLDWINRGRIGSFFGQQEGAARVREILAKADFDDSESTIAFADAILDHLRHDYRSSDKSEVDVADQLRNSRTVGSLLDFIYGLSYLQPRFGLQMGERQLHELSPGEKGALLLVFYLLVDQGDSPLLIDQPEENLDNQTVVTLLVPSIRDAKRRRQIVIVTHNPNLAVVCGADQVICAVRDSNKPPQFNYLCGAVENPELNRKVVDILEGTKPAFDIRDAAYLDQEKAATG